MKKVNRVINAISYALWNTAIGDYQSRMNYRYVDSDTRRIAIWKFLTTRVDYNTFQSWFYELVTLINENEGYDDRTKVITLPYLYKPHVLWWIKATEGVRTYDHRMINRWFPATYNNPPYITYSNDGYFKVVDKIVQFDPICTNAALRDSVREVIDSLVLQPFN